MGVSDLKTDTNAGSILDLSAQGIQKLDPSFVCSDDTQTLILDRNHIMKLDHLERSPGLQQLSVANNRLVRMMAVSRLTELRVLNLPNNSIGYIEGLRDMPHLEWLNLAGNNIKVIEHLGNCVALQHLDLSDNNVSNIGDLTKLLALKTLLLHGNSVATLRTVPTHLPAHLSILSLAENEIQDLNEVSYLAPLHELEQLSIMSNPCVMVTPSLPGFDYRPYITSWCLNLKILDGYVVSQKEGLRAEWLYSQGRGRSYRPGQHVQLVQYLATVCPLISTPALETAEDAKLEKILTKQRFHQRQLWHQTHEGCPSPPRPTRLDVEAHSPQHMVPQGGARETNKAIAPSPTATPSSRETGSSTSVLLGIPSSEPTVQINTWVGTESSQPSAPVIHSPRVAEEHLHVEDVQTDDDRVNGSLLSESTFLPITSNPAPQPNHSDSEDETETFEPDSLAPECPNWRKKPVMAKTHPPPSWEDKENARSEDKSTGGHQSCASGQQGDRGNQPTAGQQGDRGNQPQNNLFQEISSEPKVGPRHEETVVDATKSRCFESDRAAVRIQSWWRGLHTRHHHPMAREVRSEIRLRRMQDHILFLSEEFERMQKLYEEERLQRLVQEEAVKFLWKQVQSMQKWQQSVEQQLASIPQAVAPAQNSASGLRQPVLNLPLPVASSTADPACTDISFPDSGFQSTGEQLVGREDSFLSSGTADSVETVRALNLVTPTSTTGTAGTGNSPDCSLLEQYLNSVQQREEESEEVTSSDRTETPQPPSPFSPNKMAQSTSPLDKQSELQCKQDTPPSPVLTV